MASFKITDHTTDTVVETDDLRDALLEMFADFPDEVIEACYHLAQRVDRHAGIDEEEAYLNITVDRI